MATTPISKCIERRFSVDLTQLPAELRTDLAELHRRLQSAINATQPQQLRLTVGTFRTNADGDLATARVKAEGKQDPMQPFSTWVRKAFDVAVARLQSEITPPQPPVPGAAARRRRPLFGRLERVEEEKEEQEIARVSLQGPPPEIIEGLKAAIAMRGPVPTVAARSIRDVAPNVAKPQPSGDPYHGCTLRAAQGDHELNKRKNRADSAPWNLVSINSILNLTAPDDLSSSRDRWTPQQVAAVGQFEGTPVQVEGWLADLDKEGPEDCNCSSCDDVDYHLWVVDSPDQVDQKDQALVAEITPRISKDRADEIARSVRRAKTPQGLRRIRVSGWLMLDNKHLGGQTGRRTPWEIHPIIEFEVQDPQSGDWTTIFEPGS